MANQGRVFPKGVFGMRKMFEAIGKVTTKLIAVVIGIYIARFLPLWLGGIISVCAFVFLVLNEMEE
jgi:uncharacterized membrane protein (Fun14 family)